MVRKLDELGLGSGSRTGVEMTTVACGGARVLSTPALSYTCRDWGPVGPRARRSCSSTCSPRSWRADPQLGTHARSPAIDPVVGPDDDTGADACMATLEPGATRRSCASRIETEMLRYLPTGVAPATVRGRDKQTLDGSCASIGDAVHVLGGRSRSDRVEGSG